MDAVPDIPLIGKISGGIFHGARIEGVQRLACLTCFNSSIQDWSSWHWIMEVSAIKRFLSRLMEMPQWWGHGIPGVEYQGVPRVGSGSWGDVSTGSRLQLLGQVYRTPANLEARDKREKGRALVLTSRSWWTKQGRGWRSQKGDRC